MHRFVTCAVLLLALGFAAGCGEDPEVVAEQEREAQWLAIETTRQQLADKREQLEQAEAAAEQAEAAAEEEGAAEAEDAEAEDGEAMEGDGVAVDVEALETEVAELTEQFNEHLVAFINANPPVEGETPPERVQQAIRLKSDEDVRIALEYIEQGGDYRRALQIYDAAIEVDPGYQRLLELRADAEEMRFMTEERFAQVEEGMSQDEVRELLGPVNLRNIRDYEENNAVAWFYPRDEQGSAAAVWFRQNRRSGEYEVYQLDFHFKDAGEEAEEA